MPLEIIREDITRLMTDAIVHSTNPKLKMGRGSSESIFNSAGKELLTKALKEFSYCAPGDVVITSAFNLASKYIIHTVGPIWSGGMNQEAEILGSCYNQALNCAIKNNIKSIAFPLISAGVHEYPKVEALRIAVTTIQNFLLNHEIKVYLVVYDKQVYQLSTKLFTSVNQYIDDNYVEKRKVDYRLRDVELDSFSVNLNKEILHSESTFEDLFNKLDKSFSESLLSLIDKRNLSDVETYKKANISKAHFSKIRSHKEYRPSKSTVLAFCIALSLNIDECINLLEKAGFSLSNSSKHDLIVKYFIENKNYDIYEINNVLFEYDQTLLGSNTL